MNQTFKAKLWLPKDRADALISHLTNNGIVVTQRFENDSCIIEFTLETSADVLHVFHAGLHHGLNTGINSLKSIHGTTL